MIRMLVSMVLAGLVSLANARQETAHKPGPGSAPPPPVVLEQYCLGCPHAPTLVVDTILPVTYHIYTLRVSRILRHRLSVVMSLGSRGATWVSPLFPVNGESEISNGLHRCRFGEYIGMGSVRKLDLRSDDERFE